MSILLIGGILATPHIAIAITPPPGTPAPGSNYTKEQIERLPPALRLVEEAKVRNQERCGHLSGGEYALCVGTKTIIEGGGGAIAGFFGGISIGVIFWLAAWVVYFLYSAVSLLFWLVGSFLDFIIYYFVMNMGTIVNSGPLFDAIQSAWKIIRDIMNVAIIAGFVAVSISTIIGVQSYNANRFLTRLIIAALLVNFSYFFAGAIIDAANYVTVSVYTTNVLGENRCKQTVEGKLPTYSNIGGVVYFKTPQAAVCSISNYFGATIGLGTWQELKKSIAGPSGTASDQNLVFVGIFGILFLSTAGFVFFTIALQLLGRFVALIFLLITSPIGVAGMNIPYVDKYANKWWEALIGQALFAPMFFVLVTIAITVFAGYRKIFVSQDHLAAGFSSLGSGDADLMLKAIPLVMAFAVGIALLYAAQKIADQWSKAGAEYFGEIYGALDKYRGWYGNAYQIVAGGGIRGTSSRWLNRLANVTAGIGYIAPIVPGLRSLENVLRGAGSIVSPGADAKPYGASSTTAELGKSAMEFLQKIPPRPTGVVDAVKKDPLLGLPFVIRKVLGGAAADEIAKLLKSNPDLLKSISYDDAMKIADKLTDEQMQTLQGREDFSAKEKRDLLKKKYGDQLTAMENYRKALKSGDESQIRASLAELNKNMKGMSETATRLLLAENKELRNDERFLATLKHDIYKAVTSDRTLYSEKEAEDASAAREKGQHLILNDPKADPEMVKRVYNSGSDDEKQKMATGENARTVVNNISISEIQKRYKDADATGRKAIEDAFDKNEKEGVGITRKDIEASKRIA